MAIALNGSRGMRRVVEVTVTAYAQLMDHYRFGQERTKVSATATRKGMKVIRIGYASFALLPSRRATPVGSRRCCACSIVCAMLVSWG